ncbi:MAG TPA: mannose-6-phosphate isomerase, class I [Flavisolibacter sp.]|nr:mannose-6-phosphate isomerase, class I [Flavisolibacter sp.]
MNHIYKLKGVVQHYSWGGTDFIPQLLSVANPEGKPFGEYWLGAHPKSPAVIEDQNISLHQFISDHPVETLGEIIAAKFGSLPYLLKILDVRQMLSIQVHPSKSVAEEEFEKENNKGIPLAAPHRNYKDRNHKPELMVALSDFWLLHGFKKEEELNDVLNRVPELTSFASHFENGNYRKLYEAVMTLSHKEVDAVLAPLMQRIIPLYESNALQKSSEDFWAARAALTFCKDGHYDRGIFSIYFFNLLHLAKGEAIYQPAGLPHAYLEGQNVEVMANSDNVLRAGLTDKHVDVSELMKLVKFEATLPNIIAAKESNQQSFDAPVEEFHLQKFVTEAEVKLQPHSAAIAMVLEGEGRFSSGEETVLLKRGEAVLLLPGVEISAVPQTNSFTFFQVSTPLDKN